MTLKTLEGHTFDAGRLRPGSLVLDAGCRGFNFANEIRKLGYAVVPIDPDPAVWEADCVRAWEAFHAHGQVALVASHHPQKFYVGPGEAGHLTETGPGLEVRTKTIMDIFNELGFLGLAKIDIEGSEYEVLLSWPGPVADQISVEFHEHMGWGSQVHGADIYERITKHLGRWYERVTDNLLDSLWVLK